MNMEERRDDRSHLDDEAREQRIKQLILAAVTRCSECRQQYALDDFAVIGRRDHLWMVTVICEGCQSQGFITAVVESSAQDLTGTGPPRSRRYKLSELSPEEARRFAASTPVSTTDLLDLHDFLTDFDGDFITIFGKE